MKLSKDNFHSYYNSGAGNPFDTKEIINFCIDNQHLFVDEVEQQDKSCWICDNGDSIGLDVFYFFFFDTQSNIDLFTKHISGSKEQLDSLYNDIESISYAYCETCNNWVVTH